MENIAFIAGVATFIVTLASLFLAIKIELKKQSKEFLTAKLSEEKRCAGNERRLSLIEERMTATETLVNLRLSQIDERLTKLCDKFRMI